MPPHRTPGFIIAIILASILSGSVLAITAMLVVMCHVTNRRRRKEQRREGLELETRGGGAESGGRGKE